MNFKFLIYIFSFVSIIQLGAITSELIRFQLAKQIDYSGEYSKSYGRYIFHSKIIQSEFDQVAIKYQNNREKYSISQEWKNLIEKNWANRVKFELPGKLINILISILGISFFIYFKNIETDFSWKQFLSILFGMFFMKDIVINVVDVSRGGMLCNEAAIWHHFNLPVFQSTKIYAFIGLTCLLILVYLIHPKIRVRFIICGLLGSIVGILLWVFILGPLLLE